MNAEPTLSGGWRATAAALGLAWLGSVIAFIVIAIWGASNPRISTAFTFVLLASLAVLALLRNLGRVISGELAAPGVWETRLAWASGGLLAAGWLILLF